jgi:hypothetical protein
MDIARAPGRGASVVRDDPLSRGMEVRPGPRFADLGLPRVGTGRDELGGRDITVFDGVSGLQLYYGQPATGPGAAPARSLVAELQRGVEQARAAR